MPGQSVPECARGRKEVCLLRRQPRAPREGRERDTSNKDATTLGHETPREPKVPTSISSVSQDPGSQQKHKNTHRGAAWHACVVFGQATSDQRQAWHGEQRKGDEVTLLWIKSECHHSHSSNGALQMISYRRTHPIHPHPHLHTSSLSQAGRLRQGAERRRAGTVHCASGLCSSRPVSGPSYASRRVSSKSCFGTGVVSSRTKNRSPIPCSRAKDTSQLV